MYAIVVVAIIAVIGYVFTLRRIVPTNVVHIVQRGKETVSYGKGRGTNVYYEFPKWLPFIGIVVRELPVSNFNIDLKDYPAYDKDRVPFILHAKAFFHISDTNKAAEKVESYNDLSHQLEDVVKGAVRSIMANHSLDQIMAERAIFGQKFTESVNEDLKQWGVEAIKNIELMDIKDSPDSNVIHQIMEKRKSAIDMESRTEVAKNRKAAQQAELEAQQAIDVTKANTERIAGEAQALSGQAIGIAQAESARKSGIAKQEAISDIAQAERSTAEQKMEVIKVNQVKQSEIDKETAIIDAEKEKRQVEIYAEAEKFKVETVAAADLFKQNKLAEGKVSVGKAEAAVIQAKGLADADAKKAMELAGVTAQTTLAEKIGENKEYQAYMIEIKKVEVSQVIGVAQAESIATAMSKAEMKLLVNSGDVQSGMGKFSDIFTSKGASQINGLLEGLKQTDEGKGALSLFEKFLPKDKPA